MTEQYDPEYTTGQLALIFCVAPRTVRKWFNSGKLHGRVVGKRGDLRVTRSEVFRFWTEEGGESKEQLIASVTKSWFDCEGWSPEMIAWTQARRNAHWLQEFIAS